MFGVCRCLFTLASAWIQMLFMYIVSKFWPIKSHSDWPSIVRCSVKVLALLQLFIWAYSPWCWPLIFTTFLILSTKTPGLSCAWFLRFHFSMFRNIIFKDIRGSIKALSISMLALVLDRKSWDRVHTFLSIGQRENQCRENHERKLGSNHPKDVIIFVIQIIVWTKSFVFFFLLKRKS